MTIDFIMRAYLLRCAGVLLLVFLLSPGITRPYAEVLRRKSIFHMVQHAFAVPHENRAAAAATASSPDARIGRLLCGLCRLGLTENGSLQTR